MKRSADFKKWRTYPFNTKPLSREKRTSKRAKLRRIKRLPAASSVLERLESNRQRPTFLQRKRPRHPHSSQ